ncbi:hypothetical protein ACHAQH_009773 [Verticillium albo-atrum]
MSKDVETTQRRVEDVNSSVNSGEAKDVHTHDDDQTTRVTVGIKVWLAIFSMAFSFGPPVALAFVGLAAVVVQICNELGNDAPFAWVVGAWSLATACSFSLAGPLSDIFGRRNLILGGQFGALVGFIVGATAQSVAALIAAETVIGLGTGFIFVAYAGVPEMLPNRWRAIGVGILEGGITMPWGVVAPVLAGALYKHTTWRWIFYICIIVEAIALVGTAFFYWPTSRPRGDFDKTRWQQFKEIDWIGLTLFTTGLATCLVGITWGGTPEHPWDSASALTPIFVGFAALIACFVYDFYYAKDPLFPLELFKMWRGFSLLLVVLFISGMNFHALSALLPQGSLFMFTTDPVEIGVLALPTSIWSVVPGVIIPMLAHKIGHMKWLVVAGAGLQAVFIAASAATVNPNNKLAWAFVPAIGVPMFLLCTIVGYAVASLHVPHAHLGVAMGLLGTFRSAGGAVGNAIFNTVFQDKFTEYSGEEIVQAALASGLNPADLPAIIPGTIMHNLGIPGSLEGIPGMTPEIQDTLRAAVRLAYGRAFQFLFYITISFSVVSFICSLWIKDPAEHMTNHVASAMLSRGAEKRVHGDGPGSSDVEVATVEDAIAREPKTIG